MGLTVGHIYSMYGIKGVPIVLLVFLPYALLTSAILMLAVRESVKMAMLFADYAFAEKSEKLNFRLYVVKFIILFLLCLLSSSILSLICFLCAGLLR